MVRGEEYDWFGGSYSLRNSTGGSGTWTEQYISFPPQPNNGCQLDLGVNSDGSVYHLHMANVLMGVVRSDNHGASFTAFNYPGNVVWTHNWGGEADMCFDPNNPDIIYFIWSTMGINPPYGYRTVRLAKSSNRANSFSEIQTNLIHNVDVNGRQPSVMMDQNGKLFVSYTYQTTTSDFDIFVRASCDDGATFSSAVQFNTVDDDGFDVDPELCINPYGGIILTWEENGYTDFWGGQNDNPNGKIVARHVM
jgi:hypothetical protein